MPKNIFIDLDAEFQIAKENVQIYCAIRDTILRNFQRGSKLNCEEMLILLLSQTDMKLSDYQFIDDIDTQRMIDEFNYYKPKKQP